MGAAPGWPDRRGLARPDFHRPTLARAPGEQPVRRADHRRRAHARPRSVHWVGRISMKREDLEHILRAASKIAGEPAVVVLGAQAILGSYHAADLPDAALASQEAALAFWNDPGDTKPTTVDFVSPGSFQNARSASWDAKAASGRSASW